MNEIISLSATEIVEKIKAKKLTAKETVSAFIQRIQAVNPLINALNQFDVERILHDAEQADKAVRQKKSSPLGKLHGLPITIKDTCDVKGFKISLGCPALLNEPSKEDATVVARLKSEGAIILGISNTPELLASYESDNLLYGRTNNPHDLTRTPGGSSGGEAAIIAAGGSPVGIGSDAGGSIRQPAHYSGICGHKPTQGLVPLSYTGKGLISQILALGPMARHIEDINLMMQIISGPDGLDPLSPPVQFGNPHTVELKKLKIAYFFDNKNTIPSKETIQAIRNTIDAIKSEVNCVREDFPKPIENIYRLHWETFVMAGYKRNDITEFLKQSGQQKISPLLQQFLNNAEKCEFSLPELRQRLIEVEEFRYAMMRYMQNYDAIISPVAATPARLHGETHDNIHDFSYTIIHNLTGWPATVVPVGRSAEGLPIGIQIAAKPWNDHVSIALASKIQQIFGVFPIPEIKAANR